MKRIYFIVVCSYVELGIGLNILGIFPNYGYSQYILGSALMKELAGRGHNVTVIAPFRQRNTIKNYNEIYTDGLHDFQSDDNLFDLEGGQDIFNIIALYEMGYAITEFTLNHSSVQQFLKLSQNFNIVICEQFVNEAHFGFAWYFNAPLILFSSLGPSEWVNDKAGNPAPFSYVPYALSNYNSHMHLMQRLRNSFLHTFDILYRHLIAYPLQNKYAQKYFMGIPNLRSIIYNVSLILLNSHVSINEPVPLMHNMVEIGGFHILLKKLPDDLRYYLDNAKEGVVYFSMGSNLRSRDFTEKQKDVFLSVFSNLKQNVLWKFEDDSLQNQPSNLKIGKWLPQQDILGMKE